MGGGGSTAACHGNTLPQTFDVIQLDVTLLHSQAVHKNNY